MFGVVFMPSARAVSNGHHPVPPSDEGPLVLDLLVNSGPPAARLPERSGDFFMT